MFWKRKITISRPQQEVETILKHQLHTKSPFGEVLDNSFTFYKSVAHTSLGQKGIHLFRFHGLYTQTDLATELTYTVSAPLPVCIVLTFLCTLAAFIFISILVNGGPLLAIGLALFLCILLVVGITSQGNTCIEKFEKLLTQDTPRR